MSEAPDPVTSIVTPVRVDYTYTPGISQSKFLLGLKQGKLLGGTCDECGRVYVPSRGACPRCARPTSTFKEVADNGTVITLTIVRVPSENIDVPLPYCVASILLDGADISMNGLIQECELADVRIGMRVQAVWKPESEWDYDMANIKHFRPIDEPDVPFEQIKEYS